MSPRIAFYGFLTFIGILILSSCFFIVDQRRYAVVYTLAEIKQVIAKPGLYWKLPAPFQSLSFLDRRIMTLDSPETRPIQTAEKKNLVIDWLVQWRINDPKQFIRNNSGTDLRTVESRLGPLVQAALNEEVTRRTVKDVLSVERDKVRQGVKLRLSEDARSFGIQIVDVRIKRVDFPNSVTDSVYRRMESERKQEANRLRASGAADGERIRAEADKEREVTLANAYRQAQKTKGEGDEKAGLIYADAFGKNPQFAKFYRSLEAYRASFNGKRDILIVDPSSDFFKPLVKGSTP